MIPPAVQDPVAKLAARLEAEAEALHPRVGDRTVPRPLRGAARVLLREVFVAVGEAPSRDMAGRRVWVARARDLLKSLAALSDEMGGGAGARHEFYRGDRLGVIRRMEPVRIRFVVGRLGGPEDFRRFDLLARLAARVEWLWERIAQARPDLFEREEEEEEEAGGRAREEYELLWGKVRR